MKSQLSRFDASFEIDRQVGNWFVGVGAMLALLGFIASLNLLLATVAATFVLGALMFAGGILQLVHAAGVRRKAGRLLGIVRPALPAGRGFGRV